MKKILTFLTILLLLSCNETSRNLNRDKVTNDSPVSSALSDYEVKKQEKLIQEREDYLDTIAIGNIRLNTTKDVFELEKAQFLKENDSLGPLKIKSITGFFWNDRLIAIQVISQDNSYYRDMMKNGRIQIELEPYYWEYHGEGLGWSGLYALKYGKHYKNQNHLTRFDYIKGRKGIRITDFCSSNKPYSSIEKIINDPLPLGWNKKGLYVPRQFEDPQHPLGNDIFLATQNKLCVINVLKDLPKHRAEQLESMLGAFPSYLLCQEIYDIAIEEANTIIQRENEIGYNKHKNDPSYSVIIIGFIPALKEYENQYKEQRNGDKQEKLKETLNTI